MQFCPIKYTISSHTGKPCVNPTTINTFYFLQKLLGKRISIQTKLECRLLDSFKDQIIDY